MGKALIITEKPSVARDIAEALGGFTEKNKGEYYESDEFLCTYAIGHILGLLSPEDIDPKYKRWRLADLPIVPETFQLKPIERQKGRVKTIEKLINKKDVDRLINACDAAREGELIFREIVDYVKSSKPIARLWLQSMTKAAIREGFKSLNDGQKYEGLAAAASCRSWSDWLIGMNATRALTVRLKTKSERGLSWSAGRVQTPTLAILVKRELEILAHDPVPYQKIEGIFKTPDHEYRGTWIDANFKRDESKTELKEDRIFDAALVETIVKEVSQQKGEASEVRKPKPRKPPILFDLTSLQRDANRRFGWSAARTLRAAQRCYEKHKVLTYPRTSSRVLPEDYVKVVDELLATLSKDSEAYGKHAQYLIDKGRLNEKLVFNDAGVSDHFAIIPTGEQKALEGDDQRLFDLVTRQFLAVFYPPAIYEDVVRTTVVNGHVFKSKPPNVLKEAGWLAVFEKEIGKEGENNFPPLVKGKNKVEGFGITNKVLETIDFQTKPPPRIGEAGLLGLMENAGRQIDNEEYSEALHKAEGLGTAATRADIIENLKSKEYVDQSLRPTVKGIRLIDVLQRIHAETITSPELTGQLELFLSEVEAGKRTADEFMARIKDVTSEVVEAAKTFDFETIYPIVDPLGPCPKCKDPVYERAWFYGCQESTKRSDQPKKCDFLIWKDNFGRYIDRRTIRLLLSDGITGEMDGFRNSNGQTYKAILSLENNQIVRKPIAGSEENEDPNIVIEVNETPLGKCPLDDHDNCKVVETKTEFICERKKKEKEDGQMGKGFSMPRILCKREMKREEVLGYLDKGETEFLTGFISKKGRPFSAKLMLQSTGGLAFQFPERAKKKKEGSGTPNLNQ